MFMTKYLKGKKMHYSRKFLYPQLELLAIIECTSEVLITLPEIF